MRRHSEEGARACCVLCGAGNGLTRRSLATLRAACLQLPWIELDLEWVCPYCWVRAARCIRFIECVRSGALALDGVHIETEKKPFPAYSVMHQGTLNICDETECHSEPHRHMLVPRSVPVDKLVLRTDVDRYSSGEHSQDTNDCVSEFQYYEDPKEEPESLEPDIKAMFDDLETTVEKSTSAVVENNAVVVKKWEATIPDLGNKDTRKVTLLESRSGVTKSQDAELPQEYLIDVVCLSREEQLRELAERKMSAKYFGSKYRCDKCGFSTDDEVTYGYHVTKHSESSGSHACDVCGLRYQSVHSLAVHAMSHERRWQCLRCGTNERYKSQCKPHYEKCARIGGVPCTECGKFYLTSRSLKQHLNKQHRIAKRYECDHCGYKVKHKFSLAEHMCVHSKVTPYKCDLCGKRLKSIKLLKTHIKTHEPAVQTEDAYCVECDKFFRSNMLLQTHLKISLRHVSKDSFKHVCSECTERFVDASSLNIHMRRVHLNTRSYQCTLCEKAYFSQGMLRVHTRNKHLDIVRPRDQLCTVCGKAFLSKVTLKQHKLAVHTKERPYACALCPATFGFNAALYTHNKLKHKMKTQARARGAPAESDNRTEPHSEYK